MNRGAGGVSLEEQLETAQIRLAVAVGLREELLRLAKEAETPISELREQMRSLERQLKARLVTTGEGDNET